MIKACLCPLKLKIYFFNKNNSWFRVFFFLNILNVLRIFFWHKVLLLKDLMIIYSFLSCKSYALCSLFSKYLKDIFLSSLPFSFLSFLILSFSCNFSGICWRSYGLFSLWHCLPFHMQCYSFFNFRKLQDLVFILFLYVGFYFLSSTVLMLKILPVFNIFNFLWIFFSFFLVFIVFIFDLLLYLSSIVSVSYCYFFFVPCIFGLLFSFISNYFQSMGPHIWTFLALIYIVSFMSCSIFLMFLC